MSRKFCRYDRECRDLTDMPGLWSETDCEILQTRYSDPEQTNGIKTNGPPLIFIRLPNCGDRRSEWKHCDMLSIYGVLNRWLVGGNSERLRRLYYCGRLLAGRVFLCAFAVRSAGVGAVDFTKR
jgi:hypothetical protein